MSLDFRIDYIMRQCAIY